MNKAVIFDLDGTIYFGNELAPDALEVLNYLKSQDYEIIFFTNNSIKSRQNILSKLLTMGIDTNLSRVYTSAYATAKYLNDNNINKIFLIGSDGFKSELDNFNICIVDETECDAVVIGLDVNFDYHTISKALVAVNCGAKIIAANVDANYPVENGILRPGLNAIVASVVGCSGKNIDYIVGKPNTYLLESIVKDFNLDRENIWVVGDDINSDIAMAENYGCKSILIGKKHNSLKEIKEIIIKRNCHECS